MKKYPLVSFVIAVYNEEKNPFLRDTLKSMVKQKYRNLEVIVVNDGSVDKTPSILEEFLKYKNFKIINNKRNLGTAKSYNIGINHAKGEYIALCGSDDVSSLYRIQRQVNFLMKNKEVDVVGTWSIYRDENGKIVGCHCPPPFHEQILKESFTRMACCHGTMMMKKTVFERLGGYNESILAEDYEFNLRLLAKGYKMANLPEVLVYVGKREFSVSAREVKKLCLGKLYARIKYLNYFLNIKHFILIIKNIIALLLPKFMLKTIHKLQLRRESMLYVDKIS